MVKRLKARWSLSPAADRRAPRLGQWQGHAVLFAARELRSMAATSIWTRETEAIVRQEGGP